MNFQLAKLWAHVVFWRAIPDFGIPAGFAANYNFVIEAMAAQFMDKYSNRTALSDILADCRAINIVVPYTADWFSTMVWDTFIRLGITDNGSWNSTNQTSINIRTAARNAACNVIEHHTLEPVYTSTSSGITAAELESILDKYLWDDGTDSPRPFSTDDLPVMYMLKDSSSFDG